MSQRELSTMTGTYAAWMSTLRGYDMYRQSVESCLSMTWRTVDDVTVEEGCWKCDQLPRHHDITVRQRDTVGVPARAWRALFDSADIQD